MQQLNIKWMLGGMITVFVVFGVVVVVGVLLLTTQTSTNPQVMTATARAVASQATVTALASTTDADNDGLEDDQERRLGTNPRNPDTDNDGLNDGQEVNQTGTNPLDRDSNDDGVLDGNEDQSAPVAVVTPLPSINVVRPTTLPVAPVGEIPADSNPADAVVTYYSLVGESRYDQSWSMLTDAFKQIFNCCAPNYNYTGYTDWWNSVDFVEFGDVYIVSQTGDQAVIYADLRYHMLEGGVSQDREPYIAMIYDPARNAWLFNNKGTNSDFS